MNKNGEEARLYLQQAKRQQNVQELASQIPDPLRLTSSYCNRSSLYQMVEAALSTLSDNDLEGGRGKQVVNFISSLYDPKSYWTFQENMTRIVKRIGFAKEHDLDRRDSGLSYASSSAFSTNSHTATHVDLPKRLTIFVKQWRDTLLFSQQTSTPAVEKMTKMQQEEQLYVYWMSVRALWRDSDPFRDPQTPSRDGHVDDVDDADDDDLLKLTNEYLEYPDPTQATIDVKALEKFLLAEMERRKEELGLIGPVEWATHTDSLLKKLLAPFLGFDEKDRRWETCMGMGKAVNVVTQKLGRGALALVKRTTICNVHASLLTQILPIIVNGDPQLKELLRSVDDYFLQALRGTDMRLRKENVERFLRIGSVGQLISVCSANANGLNGILGPSLVRSLDNNDSNEKGAVKSNITKPSTTAPADTNDDETLFILFGSCLDLVPVWQQP
ncbi:MAG: hypothetical protein Q9221_007971 [Calogaya cf. arnoldii]